MAIITLTTDFGLDNWFVGSMKGVIKNINPDAEIVDVTHAIRPHSIPQAAFVLKNCYAYFPFGTIHTVVVDPGVGSERDAIIVKGARSFFVGPDNGVLSYAVEREEVDTVVRIQSEKYLLLPTSATFHGRDVFAPVSGYLSLGVDPEEFGPVLEAMTRLKPSVPQRISDKEIVGHILCVDPFGNLITNITQACMDELLKSSKLRRLRILVRDREISRIHRTYSEGKENELMALFGSSGHLEIAINRSRASDVLGMEEGGKLILRVL